MSQMMQYLESVCPLNEHLLINTINKPLPSKLDSSRTQTLGISLGEWLRKYHTWPAAPPRRIDWGSPMSDPATRDFVAAYDERRRMYPFLQEQKYYDTVVAARDVPPQWASPVHGNFVTEKLSVSP